MKRAILSLFIVLLLLGGCSFENVRHKVGFTTKPFSKNDGFQNELHHHIWSRTP